MKPGWLLCLAASAASAAPAAGIRVNQTGFAPLSEKIAVVPDGAAGSFEVSDAGDCNKYIVISACTLLAACAATRPATPSSPALVN